jgi:hypothetical protein
VRVYNWECGDQLALIIQIIQRKGFDLPQSKLTADGWRLEQQEVHALFEKLRSKGTPLGKYVNGQFYNGVKSGLTGAFVVDQNTRERLIQQDKSSAAILKPYLAGRDLKRWRVQPRALWLIYIPWHFPFHEDTKITAASDAAEAEFRRVYPAIYAHLEQFRDALSKRDKAETGIRYEWYAMARPRFEIHDAFEGPKIILGRFMNEPTYAFDTHGYYHNDAQYLIGGATPYLAGILNSRVCWWFLTQICTDLQSGYLQALIEYQIQIPIPVAPPDEGKRTEQLVNRIIVEKERDSSTDVSALEAEIDQIVYRLFDLTPEEIAIIENSTSGS